MGVRTPTWGAVALCLSVGAAGRPALAATIAVPAGGDLQAALNAAMPGDVITLAPGGMYSGNFTLPNKGESELFITVRSAAADGSLPASGVRVTPAYAAQLPKIQSPNTIAALRTKTGAHHWKLMFLELLANQNGAGDILALGAADSTQTQLSQVPHHIVIDRVYVHGDAVLGQKRGISLNSSDTTIVNCYISDIKAVGQDAQAIGSFNGPGNYLIENNYLEASTENVLFGGADPTIPNLVATDITFRRNHVRKPLSWRDPIIATPADVRAVAAAGAGSLAAGTYAYKVAARVPAGQTKANSPASVEVSATIATGTTGGVTLSWTPVPGANDYVVYGRTAGATNTYWKTTDPYFTDSGAAGTAGAPPSAGKWAVKNLFELKNAQDVLVEGNVFENLWVADQPGFPIVLTPRNQSGTAPWSVVQRVNFQNNLIRHTAGGVNVLGTDNINPSLLTNHLTIRDNVWDDMSTSWGSGSKVFQIGDGGDSIAIDHNTIATNVSTVLNLYGGSVAAPTPITHFAFTNNMSEHRTYGVFGSGFSAGTASIAAYLPGSTVRRNVLAGGPASKYPADNFFPSVATWKAQFANFDGGEYGLLPSSVYAGAGTDGADLGANVSAVMAQAANALSGDNSLPPGTSRVLITTTSLPNGMFHAIYAQSLACVNGASPCRWLVIDASLPSGLAFDAVAGVILGMPAAVETGRLTVMAYDPAWPANCATATLSITIDPPPFTVTVPAAAQGQVGAAYRLLPAVSGVMGTATWTLASGSLPSGISLDAFSGAIAGTPSSWGTSTAVVQARDSWSADRVDAAAVTITIAPAPLQVATPSLAAATYQQYYQASLTASGGTGAATWAIISGSLPSGVIADANGSISGTPGSIGTFTVTVQATDTQWPALRATSTLALVVKPPILTMTLPPSPPGQVGAWYQLAGSAAGSVGAVIWSLSSGTLPPGIGLNTASGVIAGLPSTHGAYTATIQARDSWGTSRVASAPLTIVVAPTAIHVTTSSLPAASVQHSYQAVLSASGGTGNTAWSLASGSLPAGLTLAASGVIAGTPTTSGPSSFTVRAADTGWTGNVATQTLTLAVASRDIVLYAADAARINGTWMSVSDSSAAAGKRLWNADAGAAKLATPLASPVNYFELVFQAEAGVAYHVWLRGKADKNYYGNDSVYVQFSGSVTATGSPANRIGSVTAMTVSIENGSNAGLSGWGWNDDAYEGLGTPIYFAQSGSQTVRVQVREDGLSLDQLVISADRYAAVSPGAAKNDATIVPK